MIRPIIASLILTAALSINVANGQQPATYKNFTAFRNLVPEIDFYASNRQAVTPYEKPAGEVIARLKNLLGANLPKGVIFICSTAEQKDAVYEPKVLKMGYSWTLTAVTAAARSQEMLARIKSQMGNNVPEEIRARISKMQPEMMANQEKQTVNSISQQIPYAVLQSMLNKEIQYRSSRLDDMTKSPLPDWLDIGIAAYASGIDANISFLQQHMDQTFAIEDVVTMARPFVAPASFDRVGGGGDRGGMPQSGMRGMVGSDGGQGFPSGGGGGMGQGSSSRGSIDGRAQGGSGGSGGQRGGGQRNIPKDEQDRMLFDGQSSTFFSFLLEKVGMDKVKELLRAVQERTEGRDFIARPEVLGPDFGKIEAEWTNWIKTLKAPQNTGGGFPRFN